MSVKALETFDIHLNSFSKDLFKITIWRGIVYLKNFSQDLE